MNKKLRNAHNYLKRQMCIFQFDKIQYAKWRGIFMNKNDKAATKNMELSKKIETENNHKAQTKDMKEEIGSMETEEDVTKYGEFVSSYFAWLTLDKQKSQAKKMEKMTNIAKK